MSIFLLPLLFSAFCDANGAKIPVWLVIFTVISLVIYDICMQSTLSLLAVLFIPLNIFLSYMNWYKPADAVILIPLILLNPYILPLSFIIVYITKKLRVEGFLPAITIATMVML
jgi:hypothetical protein